MSIDIMSEVWKHAPVDQGTLLVLLALADAAEDKTRTCYPGVGSLSEKSRLGERQVQYCLQRLREVGVITIQRNASPVKTNLYRITEVAKWASARDAIIAPHGAKAETQSATSRDAVECVSDTQPTAPKPSVTSEEPSERVIEQLTLLSEEAPPVKRDRFDEFWSVYPRKTAKEAARKAWPRAAKKADPDKIIASARRYAEKRAGEDDRYTAHPATWLNAGSYDDADLQPQPKATPAYRYVHGGIER